MNKYFLGFIIFVTTSCVQLYGQVTIGSAETPVVGALLQLKNITGVTDGDANATRGLSLPRVELKDPKKLIMGANSIADGVVGSTTVWQDHAGLVVFNIKPLLVGAGVCKIEVLAKGLHVWNGEKWQSLDAETTTSDDGTDKTNWADTGGGLGILTDYEGNKYPTKHFDMNGTDAGIWTTVNSYSTRDHNGNLFDDGSRLNPGYFNGDMGAILICSIDDLGDKKKPRPSYGEGESPKPAVTEVSRKKYVETFGLLYTHQQATNLCPTGWRLPNDADWSKLSLAHGGDKVAGGSMRKNRNSYQSRDLEDIKWGTETSALSGFASVPSGYGTPDGTGVYSFGNHAAWWSSTTNASIRLSFYYGPNLYAYTNATGKYYSVRCIKN